MISAGIPYNLPYGHEYKCCFFGLLKGEINEVKERQLLGGSWDLATKMTSTLIGVIIFVRIAALCIVLVTQFHELPSKQGNPTLLVRCPTP